MSGFCIKTKIGTYNPKLIMKYFAQKFIYFVYFFLSVFCASLSYAEVAPKQLDAESIIKILDSVELELEREQIRVGPHGFDQ